MNLIILLNTVLFLTGLLAQFISPNIASRRYGTIIIFMSCAVNFIAFSDNISAEGQIIAFVILAIGGFHYFIQKLILSPDD